MENRCSTAGTYTGHDDMYKRTRRMRALRFPGWHTTSFTIIFHRTITISNQPVCWTPQLSPICCFARFLGREHAFH